jgi:hypothetical protein
MTAGRLLTWVLTIEMLLALAFGSYVSGAYVAAGYIGPAVGHIAWLITMLLVGIVGVAAFLSIGRPGQSAVYALVSLFANYAYFLGQLAISVQFGALWMVPGAIVWNGCYALMAWWLLLSRRSPKGEAPDIELGPAPLQS